MSTSRTGNIQEDEKEYTDIIKGKIRRNLRRYLSTGQIVFPTAGGENVSITVDQIEIPTWRFGFINDELGVGEGEGEAGDDLGPADGDEEGEAGKPRGGEGHGQGKVVIDLDPEEFTSYLEEALELPRIKPKGDRSVLEDREKYNTISRRGPHSMLNYAKTFMEALKRQRGEGTYSPPHKVEIVPQPKDFRFTSYDVVKQPKNNAVIFYARDVSGSMGPKERRIVSFLCNLCSFWLGRNYDRLEEVFIIHDDRAQEVDREKFFGMDWGGGTKCSTAVAKMAEIIDQRFPVTQWNIYCVYLSDGFNWTDEDDSLFIQILGEKLLPIVNQFNYGEIGLGRPQVFAWLGSSGGAASQNWSLPGQLGDRIEKEFSKTENLAQAEIDANSFESATEAIRTFFQKGN